MVGKEMPKKTSQATTGKKQKTGDLYMQDGVPCGDMMGVGPRGTGPSGAGAGPKVGGTEMAASNSFAKGVPNAGMQDITAEVMTPAHKANLTDSVLNTKEDKTWGGVITPQDIAANNKFGV